MLGEWDFGVTFHMKRGCSRDKARGIVNLWAQADSLLLCHMVCLEAGSALKDPFTRILARVMAKLA
jgi:hypothetical protein